MTLTENTTKNIIIKLLKGNDYRIEVVTLLNSMFLQYAIDFFKKIIEAKINNTNIDTDWYKKEFLSENLPTDDIAIHSGLNKKTISNMYNSARKEIVIEASNQHYDQLYTILNSLVDGEEDLELNLTLKMGQVSVELNVSESLIVINTLAVKRAALRGGLWSTAGKRVEKPLMLTLCALYDVAEKNYIAFNETDVGLDFSRETDFYLVSNDGEKHKCEVKLMGKGNPESADAVIARDSSLFVADKLSYTNKAQLDHLQIKWVELRQEDGFKRFKSVLEQLKIPHKEMCAQVDFEHVIDNVFSE